MTAVWEWADHLHRLAWPQRLTLVLLLTAGVLNLYVSTRPWIDRPWRRCYRYKGTVCLLAGTWYVLLVTGAVNAAQFVQVTRWIQPTIILALMISAIQHLGERRALQRRAELHTKLVDQAERIVREDDAKGPA